MNFGSITRVLGKGALTLKKHADTIELVVGATCIVGGTVALIKEADKVVEAKKTVDEAVKNEVSKPEVFKVAVVEYTKATWKGLALETTGLVLMGISHATIHRQLEAVSASLAATSMSFNQYRKRVIDDQGEQKDFQYLTGGVLTEVEQKPDGTTITTVIPVNDPAVAVNYIPHSFFFDEHNPNWTKNAACNRTFLEQNLKYLNIKLSTYGYLTENQIREAIGEKWTVAGQAAGILYENPDGTTNQLSFGLNRNNDVTRAFMEGHNPSVLITLQTAGGAPISNNIFDKTQTMFELY